MDFSLCSVQEQVTIATPNTQIRRLRTCTCACASSLSQPQRHLARSPHSLSAHTPPARLRSHSAAGHVSRQKITSRLQDELPWKNQKSRRANEPLQGQVDKRQNLGYQKLTWQSPAPRKIRTRIPAPSALSHPLRRGTPPPWHPSRHVSTTCASSTHTAPQTAESSSASPETSPENTTAKGAGTQSAPRPSSGVASSASGVVQQRGGRGLYTKFVQHCMLRMSQRMKLSGYHIKDEWRLLKGQDGASGTPALCRSTAASAPKIRFVRSADISAGANLQVLNLVAFPRPTHYLPYFCADLVTFPRGHLIVIDMNPLFLSEAYLDRFIRRPVMPVCNKYLEVLPWGGEFTAESLQFFSPALLWSRLPLDHDITNGPVFQAFCDYLEVWLDMVDASEEETDPDKIADISEAQHRYMSWRAEKDPGRPVLTRLFGSERCEDYIHNFLFDGLYSLGSKGFLDYFPQYRLPDGSICKKRSMAGKSYTSRPWDEQGRLIL